MQTTLALYKLGAIIQLTRLNKPVGIELLLWPTLWALWLAQLANPPWQVLCCFVLGTIAMRSAGCAINDYADRKVDGKVARTRARPLVTGALTAREALLVFAVLLAASASLLLWLPVAVFYWSIGAVVLATVYPFMKRYTHLPQVVLGAAFAWAIPMAFVAVGQPTGAVCWLLYAATLCWTVSYDTLYAMADREEDKQAGVKSTAILFGRHDLLMVAALQFVFVIMLVIAFYLLAMPWPMFIVMAGILMLLWGLTYSARSRMPEHAFSAFLRNVWVGRILFIAIVVVLGVEGLYVR